MASDFQALTASAPSKVILHGEHAVVYGMTAVGASLDLRTSITIKPHPNKVVVHFPDLGLSDSWTILQLKELFRDCPKSISSVCPDYLNRLHDFLGVDPSNLRMAGVICFLYLYTVILDPDPLAMELHVSSEIPLGAGLGSSAALSVCLAAGLTSVLRQVAEAVKIYGSQATIVLNSKAEWHQPSVERVVITRDLPERQQVRRIGA